MIVNYNPPDWTDPENLRAVRAERHAILVRILHQGALVLRVKPLIEVEVKEKKMMSPKEYGPKDVWNKVFELYKHFYKKNNEI